jgi:DNA-binding GntR family transcriptional regulator
MSGPTRKLSRRHPNPRAGVGDLEPSLREGGTSDDPVERLRDAIGAGHFLPNERLTEMSLCEFLGVNRSVVRNVLAKLEEEGLIVRLPHRGAQVRLVAGQEAIEILECRSLLEGLAARYAALRMSPQDLQRLRLIHSEAERKLSALDLLGYLPLNAQFHRLITEACGHPTAIRLLRILHALTARYRGLSIFYPGRSQQAPREHRAIIEAIARHDSAAAEDAMRVHLEHSLEALKQALERGDLPPEVHSGLARVGRIAQIVLPPRQ